MKIKNILMLDAGYSMLVTGDYLIVVLSGSKQNRHKGTKKRNVISSEAQPLALSEVERGSREIWPMI
ncbi:MAG: hypothetical protein ACYS19_14830 [Planctomycetota bacterium]